MSDRTFVDTTLDATPRRTNSVRIAARRPRWPFINQLFGLRRRPNEAPEIAVEADRPALRRRAPNTEWGQWAGSFLYLVCVALVAAVTIGVFFGIGLYSLDRSIGGEAPARTKAPAEVATSLDKIMAMTGPTTQPGAIETQPGPTAQPGAATQAPGVSAEPGGDPIEERGDKRTEPKRFAMASAEIVSGTVTQVSDAMTWVVGDKTVHLWGIRPGAHNLHRSLEKVADWVRAKGPVECRRQAHSSRYRCSTSAGDDVAEAVLLAGVARTANRALLAYRNAATQAHRNTNTP
jgi:hypothetical protein